MHPPGARQGVRSAAARRLLPSPQPWIRRGPDPLRRYVSCQLPQGVDQSGKLRFTVRGGQRDAQARRSFRHRRRTDGRHPQAACVKGTGDPQGVMVVADDHRLDCRWRRQQAPARGRKSVAQLGDELPQVLPTCVTRRDQVEAGSQRAGDDRAAGGGEDIAAGALLQPLDDRCVPATKAPAAPAALPRVPI
jgi:hypothetical protein